MTIITLKDLTPKQREAWRMRYRYGWRMKRIALEMGVNVNSVSQLLQRALLHAGLPRRKNLRIIRTKPRLISCRSLSEFNNY